MEKSVVKGLAGIALIGLAFYLIVVSSWNSGILLTALFFLFYGLNRLYDGGWLPERQVKKNASPLTSPITPKSSTSTSSIYINKTLNDYKRREKKYYSTDECVNCNGLGFEYVCEKCHSTASFSGSSEHYDGDLFCFECSEKGELLSTIKEIPCRVCN